MRSIISTPHYQDSIRNICSELLIENGLTSPVNDKIVTRIIFNSDTIELLV